MKKLLLLFVAATSLIGGGCQNQKDKVVFDVEDGKNGYEVIDEWYGEADIWIEDDVILIKNGKVDKTFNDDEGHQIKVEDGHWMMVVPK